MARTRCFLLLVCLIIVPLEANSENNEGKGDPIYHNEFAVYIPTSSKVADEIAAKYGYENLGQIGALDNYYLFRHQRLHKRSLTPSFIHHDQLAADPLVMWAEQQVEKKRVKRDLTYDPADTDHTGSRRDLTYAPTDTDHTGSTEESSRSPRQFFPTSFANGFGRFNFFKPQINLSPIRRGSRRFPDPLFPQQWYLSEGAVDGHDMNVTTAWAKGYTGKGVVISILDDGIQHNHPDLAQNYDPQASTDINDNDPDPMPRDNGDNKHGTRCAGEVASVAFNDFCGVGIAYNASIGGVRMLDGTVNDAVEARAISLNPDHVDIYSASWGPEDDGKTVDGPGPLAKRAFINGVIRGRHGKGSIFVWASGNGGRHTDNCNCDGYTNSIFTLSISSASQRGLKPWYLEECSSTLASTYSSGTPGLDRSVATADMDGSLRPDRMCTIDHTGTSASAPLAAGLCALALEANPDLTWRDMQHLVVRSSRRDPLGKEEGWFVNAVGRHVSHKFGYGLMDAGAMVALAEKWTTVPPQHVCQTVIDRTDLTIPAIRGSSIQAHITTDGCTGTSSEVRYLEHVQAVVSLRFLPRGNINIKLISPSGTASTLLFERPRDVLSEKFDDWPFLSVHFWGEKAAGTWRLVVTNAGSKPSSHPGVLIHWQLILHGTKENPERLRFSPGSSFPSFSPNFNQFGDLIFGGSVPDRVYQSISSEQYKGKEGISSGKSGEIEDFEKNNKSEKEFLGVCHSECLGGCTGTGPQNCKICRHFILQWECVSSCPDGTFASEDKACLPCHDSCSQCIGPRQNQCSSCPAQSLFVPHMGLCVETCPTGYFAVNGSCSMCINQCAECKSGDYCQKCDHHLLLSQGTCQTNCPDGSYEGLINNCEVCNSPCKTCVAGGEQDCASCVEPLYLSRGRCVHSCPKGTYGDPKTKECMVCPMGCSSCDENTCSSCNDGWRPKSGVCVAYRPSSCDINEFSYGGSTCAPCHPSCLNCIGPNETECLHCQPPTILLIAKCVSACPKGHYEWRSRCLPCPHGCSTCTSSTQCSSCDSKFHLHGEKCVPSCPSGFYSDRGICVQCDSSCSSCWGPRRDQCFSCPPNQLLLDSTCRKSCPEGFFEKEKSCQPCYHNCKECSGSGLHSCTSCFEYLTLDGGMCLECRGGRYYSTSLKRCVPCHDSCLTCNGKDMNSCTSCQTPFSLHPETRTCRACCKQSTMDERTENCCHCDSSTGQCLGAGTTDKRRIALSPPARNDVNESPPSAFLSSTTALVVLICLVNVVVFVIVFAVVQARSTSRRGSNSYSYRRLPLQTSSIDALPIASRKPHSISLSSVVDSDEESEEEHYRELFTRT